VAFFSGRVNKVRRQLKSSDNDVVTVTALRGACITFAEGIAGVKYGTRPVPVPSERANVVRNRAIQWFDALTRLLGAAIENREQKIASAPAILASLGAMGHSILYIHDEAAREKEIARLIAKLRTVDWDRGPHWDGIAGKVNPKGVLSTGGSKEYAYAVYAALNDETSPGYTQVRPLPKPVALAANA
jgi:hypothetical protein